MPINKMKEKPPLLTIEEAKTKGLWFVSKSYGYGWVPITWQGWVTTLGFVVAMIGAAFLTIEKPDPSAYEVLLFLKIVALAAFLLVIICYKKGEKAYWRWGGK